MFLRIGTPFAGFATFTPVMGYGVCDLTKGRHQTAQRRSMYKDMSDLMKAILAYSLVF